MKQLCVVHLRLKFSWGCARLFVQSVNPSGREPAALDFQAPRAPQSTFSGLEVAMGEIRLQAAVPMGRGRVSWVRQECRQGLAQLCSGEPLCWQDRWGKERQAAQVDISL